MRRVLLRNFKLDRCAVNELMRRTFEFDQKRVRPRGKPFNAERFTARI